MREFFERYDVLLLPTCQVEPFDADLEYPRTVGGVPQETYLDWMRSCYYVSVTASPALSVPAGFTPGGLPVGLEISSVGILMNSPCCVPGTRSSRPRALASGARCSKGPAPWDRGSCAGSVGARAQ